eukprot:TRINITY_DN6209_c0_g1_i1.p1 TRINITY_DN6209_c0_g1~~TRINITY_DN6209_c0_g1_i1.p1  ORF type:complete len:254 (-),score=40.24 TRINITY_DN6209_c0_g1_i1:303-1064(-)
MLSRAACTEAEDHQKPKGTDFDWGASLAPVKNTFIHYHASFWWSSLPDARRQWCSSPAALTDVPLPAALTDVPLEPPSLGYGLPVRSLPSQDAVLPPTMGVAAKKSWADESDEDSEDSLVPDGSAGSAELRKLSSLSTRPSFRRPQEALSMKPGVTTPECNAEVVSRAAFFSMPMSSEEKVLAHERQECKPCAYQYAKEDGCRQGDSCEFCHLCGPDTVKERKRAQKRKSRCTKRQVASLSKMQAEAAFEEGP